MTIQDIIEDLQSEQARLVAIGFSNGYKFALDKFYKELSSCRYDVDIQVPPYSECIVDMNGENESEFKKIDDVIIKIDDLLAFDWLKTMRVVYRP